MDTFKKNIDNCWMENSPYIDWMTNISERTGLKSESVSMVLEAAIALGIEIGLPQPEDGHHITRYKMYQRISQFFKEKKEGKVLEVSGEKGAIYRMFDQKLIEYQSVIFPEEDVQNLSYKDNTFDYVICDQVIEHIESPQKAIDEINRVLKPGGWIIVASCFLDHIHTAPDNVNDYWRFTPQALRFLLKNYSNIYQCEGWGNREAFSVVMYGGLQKYFPVSGNPELERITSYNEYAYPLSVWAIAQK